MRRPPGRPARARQCVACGSIVQSPPVEERTLPTPYRRRRCCCSCSLPRARPSPAPSSQTRRLAAPTSTSLIAGGRILDGTGAPWFAGDVGIVGDRIYRDRDARRAHGARRASTRSGAYVAPGFIDMLGPVGAERPGGRPGRVQDHAGRHDRDHRRRQRDRAAQRSAGRRGEAELRCAEGDARLPDARRVLHAARNALAAGHQRRQRSSAPAGFAPTSSAISSAWPPPRSWTR